MINLVRGFKCVYTINFHALMNYCLYNIFKIMYIYITN